MSQNILYLTRTDSEQFAVLNLDQFLYIDGIEETEEHPAGSKSRLYAPAGCILTVPIPYRQLADLIAKTIKDNYEFSAKWQEASRQAVTEASGKMMREVMRDFHDDH